mmetsp:Transcript_29894/g.76682  ORF Transcript_29894/g.76682 Transcript_29894/m.76682 type:complete len:336 (-) Transcript_29894:2447-3454(-)
MPVTEASRDLWLPPSDDALDSARLKTTWIPPSRTRADEPPGPPRPPSRMSTICACLAWLLPGSNLATSSGVRPWPSRANTSAFHSRTRIRTAGVLPHAAATCSAVPPRLYWASGGAPAASSSMSCSMSALTTAAHSRAALRQAGSCSLAPCSFSIRHTCRWPSATAADSGVSPNRFAKWMLAPWRMSSRTRRAWPRCAAIKTAVCPSASCASTGFQPEIRSWLRSSSTWRTLPRAQAWSSSAATCFSSCTLWKSFWMTSWHTVCSTCVLTSSMLPSLSVSKSRARKDAATSESRLDWEWSARSALSAAWRKVEETSDARIWSIRSFTWSYRLSRM